MEPIKYLQTLSSAVESIKHYLYTTPPYHIDWGELKSGNTIIFDINSERFLVALFAVFLILSSIFTQLP